MSRKSRKSRDDNDRLKDGDLPPEPDADCVPMPPPPGPVREVLTVLEFYPDSERPRGTLLNVVSVLELDPRWRGRVRFNEFSAQVELARTPVGMDGCFPQSDALDGEVALWLADQYRLAAPTGRVAEAIAIVARRHSHHPVRDYLRSLVWDKAPRASSLLTRYFGVDGSERPELVARLSVAFLVSCVARVEKPGCKVDTTLILSGPQGAHKSTGMRVLAVRAEWFSDTHLDLGSKDLFEQLQGRWIYELAELDAFRGREWSKIKATLSSARDTWRRPYQRHSGQIDRQVVFVGTTNEDNFLGDPTGSRRFWPVRAGVVDVRALLADRDQLWAEAYALYSGGTRWWLTSEQDREVALASEEFRVVDPWEELVIAHINNKVRTTVPDILANAIQKQKDEWSPHDQQRICAILKRLGWNQRRPRTEPGGTAGRVRVWEPPS